MSQGHLNIIQEGEGRLQLFVDDYFNIGGSSSMNNNSNPGGNERSPLNLLIAYGGSTEFDVGGNQPINGNIFIKDADLSLGGSGQINGNIITGGENVRIDGAGGNNSRVVYAPNAHVIMTGSGSVNGSVVAKSFEGQGSFDVVYTTEFEDTLPDLEGGSGGGGTEYTIAFWY
jgi:cytoskeletal protein CcmA (bactofilin family)